MTPPSHQHTEGCEKHFAALEDFLGHVDGFDLTHWGDDGNGGTAGLDEGTCDATEAFAAFEFIKVDHAYLSNRVKALTEALASCVAHMEGLPDPEDIAFCIKHARTLLTPGEKP